MVYLNDHISNIDLPTALRCVSPQRAAYALRYRQPVDQRLSLAVWLLLQQALKAEYGMQQVPDFVYGHHGKPHLKGYPHIHFNLSHCPRAVLCVTDNRPVGCDVEAVPSRLDIDLCRYCCNEEETTAILDSHHPTLAFATLWTKKESLLKLTGEGLTDHLPNLLCSEQTDKVSFSTFVAPDKSYVYTICTSAEQK